MALSNFDSVGKKVTAVFVRRKVGPDKYVYERQPYNIVIYHDGTGDPASYVEPIRQTVGDDGRLRLEVFDELFIDDKAPYETTGFKQT